MDRGNDALGEAPMVPLVRGTAAAGSGVRASVHRMVAQLGQSVGKVTIRPASLLLALAFALQFIAWWRS